MRNPYPAQRKLHWIVLTIVGLPFQFLAFCAAPVPARAEGFTEDFRWLDRTRWRAVSLAGERKLPGPEVSARDGLLRITGTTSAEGINVGGVRALQAFSAAPGWPFRSMATICDKLGHSFPNI